MRVKGLEGVRKIHFIGIGGISMSGIARVLQKRGYKITGSDSSQASLTEKLEKEGMKIFYGHSQSNIESEVDLIVRTSTVSETNPEMIEANQRNIKVVERYEMLNLLSQYYQYNLGVAGSHGKTTSTSYLWKILQTAMQKPSLFLGSIIYDETMEGNCFEQQFDGDEANKVAVYETDESDRSFEKMTINNAIITNIDNDHLEFYSNSFFNLYESFVKFANNIIAQNGVLIVGLDFPYASKLFFDVKQKNPQSKIISYSLDDERANYYARNIIDDGVFTIFNLCYNGVICIEVVKIPSIGKHNVFNAVGALALFLNVYPHLAHKIDGNVFSGLKGIDKRFMPVGSCQIGGTKIDIVDDYAHHPTEIKAIIKAVNDSKRWDNFLLVFEPHKYTRVISIYDDFLQAFKEAKDVIMMDIFGVSGGLKIDITKEKFAGDIKTHSGFANIVLSPSNKTILDDVYNFVSNHYKTGNTIVLFIGAGLSSYFAKKSQSHFDQNNHQNAKNIG